MEFLKDETKAAILKDEFAFKSIEAAIELLYILGVDFNKVRLDGKIVFHNDNVAVAYAALCELVGRESPPDTDAKVPIGSGYMMPVSILTDLSKSFRQFAKERAAKQP